MARLPRLSLPGCAHHIIQRGNNREACFYDHADYKTYLAFLQDAAGQYQVAIHAYVLMTNHVHLLATPATSDGISRMMQAQGRKYVRYFNHSYDRTGTLWEGRFKSTLVDSETYLLTLYHYIELNPVRAGMAQHASDYPWSSYQSNAIGRAVELVTPHPHYQQLGKTASERRECYRALFQGRMAEHDMEAIRTMTDKG